MSLRKISSSEARSHDEVLVTLSTGAASGSPQLPAESFSIRKSDTGGHKTSFFHGSAKEPHEVVFHGGLNTKPVIRHGDVLESQVGVAVPIQADIRAALKPARVRLHYRHLDQAEDWQIVNMKGGPGDQYQAQIPGEFAVPGWDLMYAIEVVDEAGAGQFYPDWESREPFVVIKVSSKASGANRLLRSSLP